VDEALLSGPGTTYNGLSNATCNCVDSGSDGSTCSIYSTSSSCVKTSKDKKISCNTSSSTSGYGWGNHVIFLHADGKYTKYTHIEYGTVKVMTSGTSASAGCWVGDEGGTGASSGNKNGCGDHVHFQWQSGGSRSDPSVSGSFSETGALTSSSCKTYTPTLGAMSCSL